MARKTVRVKIPAKKPDAFLTLLEAMIKQHELLGDESPLKYLPEMEGAKSKAANAKGLRTDSLETRKKSESLMQQSMTELGMAPGQSAETPGTLYDLALRARNHLLNTYKGSEEKLSEWGFDVVVGQAKGRTK